MNQNISNLTNRFRVAVRLFSSRSRRTSKCGKNKKVAHEAMQLNVAVVTAVWSWVPAVAVCTGHLSYTFFSLYSSTCVLFTCLELILIYLCFYRSLSSHAERCFPWPESYHPATRLYPGWERCEYQNWSASPCHCKGQLVGQPVGVIDNNNDDDDTGEAIVGGHLRDAKKVSVLELAAYENGSRKRLLEVR